MANKLHCFILIIILIKLIEDCLTKKEEDNILIFLQKKNYLTKKKN